MTRICILGGGNIAHALAGELSLNSDISVDVLTRKPQKWSNVIELHKDDRMLISNPIHVTDDKNILKKADVVIVSLPATVRFEYLQSIRNFINKKAMFITMPSTGGINFLLERIFPDNSYACFQRVSCIARIISYGHSVNSQTKQNVDIYFSKNTTSKQRQLIQDIFNMKISQLNTYWPLFLSNSNPIIHIARICEILNNYPSNKNPFFYEEWGDYASELAINMDKELSNIFNELKVHELKDLLTHYEVNNSKELTVKINSIASFKQIKSPMIEKNGKYYFDINSRYLVEDLPFGTCFIKYFAEKLGIQTPNIDYAIEQVQKIIGKKFIVDCKLNFKEWTEALGFDFKQYYN